MNARHRRRHRRLNHRHHFIDSINSNSANRNRVRKEKRPSQATHTRKKLSKKKRKEKKRKEKKKKKEKKIIRIKVVNFILFFFTSCFLFMIIGSRINPLGDKPSIVKQRRRWSGQTGRLLTWKLWFVTHTETHTADRFYAINSPHIIL